MLCINVRLRPGGILKQASGIDFVPLVKQFHLLEKKKNFKTSVASIKFSSPFRSAPLLVFQRLQNLRFYSVGLGVPIGTQGHSVVVRADLIPGVGLCTHTALRQVPHPRIYYTFLPESSYTQPHTCTYMNVYAHRNT